MKWRVGSLGWLAVLAVGACGPGGGAEGGGESSSGGDTSAAPGDDDDDDDDDVDTTAGSGDETGEFTTTGDESTAPRCRAARADHHATDRARAIEDRLGLPARRRLFHRRHRLSPLRRPHAARSHRHRPRRDRRRPRPSRSSSPPTRSSPPNPALPRTRGAQTLTSPGTVTAPPCSRAGSDPPNPVRPSPIHSDRRALQVADGAVPPTATTISSAIGPKIDARPRRPPPCTSHPPMIRLKRDPPAGAVCGVAAR